MDWLVDIFSGSGIASIVGLAGGLITKFTELKAKKAEYGFKLKMREFDVKESELERTHEIDMADKHIERAQVEGELMVEAEEVKAFKASQEKTVVGWLRVVRPAITAYMLAFFTYVFYKVHTHVGGIESLSNQTLSEIYLSLISAVLYLVVLCVSWWFGSRGGNLMGKFK